MRRSAFIWIAAVTVACASSAGAGPEKCGQLRYEPRQTISGSEFHRLTTGEEFGPNNRTNFRIWGFDYEDRPEKDGWYAVALVQAATGDLGETPVTGVVWINHSVEIYYPVPYRAPDDNTIVFHEATPPAGCKAATLTLVQRRQQIFADGRLVGTIDGP